MEAELAKHPEQAYQSNFEKLVGKIDPNQSWDFSRGVTGEIAATRAVGEITITPGDYYNVEQTTLNWLTTELPEKGRGRYEVGNNFTLNAPAESFTLIPIYQGHAACHWDLYVKRENREAQRVWTKSQGLQRIRQGGADDAWEDVPVDGNNDNPANEGSDHTMGVKAVRGQELVLGGFTPGERLTFILKITKHGEWIDGTTGHMFQIEGAEMSSEDGMMVALPCPRPSNIAASDNVIVIGCEDNDVERTTPIADITTSGIQDYSITNYAGQAITSYDLYGSDWDKNDIVFLLKSSGEANIEEVTKKRYMVEDLGTTDDIDFNDVIIDLASHQKMKPKVTTVGNETKYEWEPVGSPTQTATVRAMGGTLDFEFYVGTSTTPVFTKSELVNDYTIYNTLVGNIDYNKDMATYKVSGWNPSTNNVRFKLLNPAIAARLIASSSITVEEDGYTLSFPEPGAAPYIIAFPVTKQWRDERHLICKHWLFDEEDAQGECPNE